MAIKLYGDGLDIFAFICSSVGLIVVCILGQAFFSNICCKWCSDSNSNPAESTSVTRNKLTILASIVFILFSVSIIGLWIFTFLALIDSTHGLLYVTELGQGFCYIIGQLIMLVIFIIRLEMVIDKGIISINSNSDKNGYSTAAMQTQKRAIS